MAKLATNLKVIVQVNQTFFLVMFYFSVFLSIFPTTDVGEGWGYVKKCPNTEFFGPNFSVFGLNMRFTE